MRPPDDVTRLRHMLDAARKAVRFSMGKKRRDLERDELLGFAVVRLLEIIGEAAGGVSDGLQTRHPDIPWRRMSGMRNRLIHEYFEVNMEVVWETVTGELPPLIAQLQKVLEEEAG